MPDKLLKRMIEQASNSLVDAVYQRILVDRLAKTGQMTLFQIAPTWEEITARAVTEAILTRGEASRLLAGVRDSPLQRLSSGRQRLSQKKSKQRVLDRAPYQEADQEQVQGGGCPTPAEGIDGAQEFGR